MEAHKIAPLDEGLRTGNRATESSQDEIKPFIKKIKDMVHMAYNII